MHHQMASRSGSRLVFKRSSSSSSAASSSGDSNGYANAFNATSLLGLRSRQQQPYSPGIVPFPAPVRGVTGLRPGRQPYDLFGKSREERMARRNSSSSSSVASSSGDLSPSMRNGYDNTLLTQYPIDTH